MTINTLFLPLLGGFLFYYLSRWTAYFATTQSAQPVLFFSALAGLVLLFIARCITYYCEEHPAGLIDSELLVGAVLLPPLLMAQVLGWVMAVLQSTLEQTRISLLKAALAVTCSWLALWIFVEVIRSARYFDPLWGVRLGIYWPVLFAIFVGWSLTWSRVTNMQASSVHIRATSLVFGLMIGIHSLSQKLPAVLEFWTGMAKAIGDEKTTLGVGTAFLACCLGPLLAVCFNAIYDKRAVAERLVRRSWVSGLEKLVYSAAKERRFVMLTMDDCKVYVGVVGELFANQRSKDAYIKILPMMSGYRDAQQRVHFTTYYRRVYERVHKEHRMSRSVREDFEKVLPVDRIVSAGRFSPDYYYAFQDEHTGNSAKPGRKAASKKRQKSPKAAAESTVPDESE